MNTIKLHEIKQDPDLFLNRVEAGEHSIVLRNGQAIAELRLLPTSASGPRPFGLGAGEFEVPADFDAPLADDVLREFEGK